MENRNKEILGILTYTTYRKQGQSKLSVIQSSVADEKWKCRYISEIVPTHNVLCNIHIKAGEKWWSMSSARGNPLGGEKKMAASHKHLAIATRTDSQMQLASWLHISMYLLIVLQFFLIFPFANWPRETFWLFGHPSCHTPHKNPTADYTSAALASSISACLSCFCFKTDCISSRAWLRISPTM